MREEKMLVKILNLNKQDKKQTEAEQILEEQQTAGMQGRDMETAGSGPIKEERKASRTNLSDTQYGPFLDFIRQEDITDIDFNGKDLWIKDIRNTRKKITEPEIVEKLDQNFISNFAAAVANLVGENFTATDNVIEAETEDLRITVVHDSVALTGINICIRQTPPIQRITPLKAIKEHYCEEKMLHLLANCVKARLNMVFCGEPGVGKTECAKFLTAFIPPEQKVITVEDTREVHYREINPGKDCVELRVNDNFSYDDAMEVVLRMNPARVMLSEARGEEVKQLVKCWTTGITGFTTLHTDDVRKIPDRILNMMPSREDAERLENDVYIGMDVGILLDTRINQEGQKERYIRQIGFFYRENHRNFCQIVAREGHLAEEISIPDDTKTKMAHEGIADLFYSAELESMLEKERERKNQERRKKVFIA